jgi:hypothetical protein
VVDDPGQQLGVAGVVIADRASGDRNAIRGGDLDFVGVGVGVGPDGGNDTSASMGTGLVLPAGSGSRIGTGLGRSHRAAYL